MYTVDPYWRLLQQNFLNANDGQVVKELLVICIDWCELSHDQNMATRTAKYEKMLEWDPVTNPNPPAGWYLDPADNEWKEGVNSEVNDG